jgi:hypothetical protein
MQESSRAQLLIEAALGLAIGLTILLWRLC